MPWNRWVFRPCRPRSGRFILAGLLLDSYVRFDLLDLLVPFAASWRPAAVAAGVVALYLLLAVELTSLARRHLPHRLWRRLHFGALPLLAAATVHLLAAGFDRAALGVVVLLGVTTGAVSFLVLLRLLYRLQRPPHHRAVLDPLAARPRERVESDVL